MKERPILFNGDMVRAILSGAKTQTRRPMRPQPPKDAAIVDPYNGDLDNFTAWSADKKMFLSPGNINGTAHWRCPYGQVGDRLWVRETFGIGRASGIYYYKTCSPNHLLRDHPENYKALFDRWHPSIHMPRRASRITLEITNIRVDRVQDISEGDAKAEGVATWCDSHKEKCFYDPNSQLHTYPTTTFSRLWDSIYADRGFGWRANCWVWVMEFKRIQK